MSNRAPGREAADKTGTEKAGTTPGGAGPAKPGNRAPGNRRRQARDARLAAARAAQRRAKRRRQAILSAVVAVVVAGVIIGLALWLTGGKKTNSTASAGSSAAPAVSASPAPIAGPTVAPSFPPVPAGADPALGTKPKVTKGSGSVSSLKVTTLIKGKGAAVKSGQTIVVNYVGVTYKDGKEFDSSWKNSQTFSFPLGQGQVIPGWDQGLVGVTVGSRVQLDIPSNLAYGDNPTGGQPAGALRFVVDVLSAK
ncbi:MAG: FKBP-type peptidyl-prolyl cis-trans isomerase [Micromonosporaceae bacterium]|nr:FKBP-type peptidyl-prolyl cis-trans isomerase [Micromonosporaceae bacterium]